MLLIKPIISPKVCSHLYAGYSKIYKLQTQVYLDRSLEKPSIPAAPCLSDSIIQSLLGRQGTQKEKLIKLLKVEQPIWA